MDREFFSDRDESWVLFNERVLDQVRKKKLPLAERLMFIGIGADNLDEFLMSRYGRRLMYSNPGTDHETLIHMCQENYERLNKMYDKFIRDESCPVIHEEQLPPKGEEEALKIFEEQIFPVIHPRKVKNKLDSLSKQINVFVELVDKKTKEISHSVISIPETLKDYYFIKSVNAYMPVEDFVCVGLKEVYRGLRIARYTKFQVNRSVNIDYHMDDDIDPKEGMEMKLKGLRKSKIMSVQLEEGFYKHSLSKIIRKLLKGDKSDTVWLTKGRIGLSRLKSLDDSILKEEDQRRSSEIYNTFPTGDMFSTIKESDQLVYHPFESFENSVIKFIKQAANDKDVLSIKMTLYRIPSKSKIIDALMRARENNKAVTVMVELKARFNERANIYISRMLEEAGVEIIYSEEDIKTHAKMCVVTRMEKGKVRYYSHIGTGNYSDTNSKLYTDYSYFTSSSEVGKDLVKFFSMITNPGIEKFDSNVLSYAPFTLRSDIEMLIDREISKSKRRKRARIFMKCNALTDNRIAEKLYEASCAGVKIVLMVRGACVVRPGIKGVSENITVVSHIGRYLEHSRVYMFGEPGKKDFEVFIGSADMMVRNLDRRFELLVRLNDEDLKHQVVRYMDIYLKDNVNMYILETLRTSGGYSEFYALTSNKRDEKFDSHQVIANLSKEKRIR